MLRVSETECGVDREGAGSTSGPRRSRRVIRQ